MKKQYNITKELVSVGYSEEIYSSDLVSFVYPEFSTEYEENYLETDYNINEIEPDNLKAYFSHEVHEIEINKMKELISNAEENNATHIGIYFHGDHGEYEAYGYKLYAETEEEKNKRIDNEKVLLSKKQEEAKIKLLSYASENGLKINFE